VNRVEIMDDMAKVGSMLGDSEWATDDKVDRGFQFWIALGRPANTTITVENGPNDKEQYRVTRRATT
jgi:hypothetical protein